ncbi:intraflagellar transport protein 70A-like [Ochotona princeps]|uniref:intraflagellar transport protein 70A-like n=1 Tax=Ochotona princeps TaxID=9978 RepID=UPI00271484B1|nr:intraflagellar transport protein 70A-like [Ochotona princeps]
MAGLNIPQIPDGEFTAVVYRLIRDARYAEAVQLLGGELQRCPKSRAGLSLLGYCYYRLQEFALAAECYEQLSQLYPELEQYRLYQAQALYKACLFPEATRVAFLLLDNPTYHNRVLRLQAAIKYSEGDLPGARSLVEQLLSDAMITCQTAPDEAFIKLDGLAGMLTEQLRKLTIQVQEARHSRDDEGIKKAVNEYDDTLEKYIPVLMAQAKIYWNLENYSMVEKIFRKSVEFCNDHDVWKLNVAHVLFMQENKYKEAIGFYEPIVKKHYDNILSVSAVVLANLCVSYIMTSQNEEAEELMRKIEKEEEQLSYDDPDKKTYHLCIVNLVIGTLYCAKGNYDFGISRVIKSLEPYNKKLGTDTWYYAKRCFLSLLENMSKHTIMLRDSVIQECVQFLENCELYGRNIPAVIEQPLEEERMHIGKNTVTYESRQLRALIYEIIGWNTW